MEILVRIAIDKYYKSGITESIYDAVEKMIDDDGIKEWLEYFDKS